MAYCGVLALLCWRSEDNESPEDEWRDSELSMVRCLSEGSIATLLQQLFMISSDIGAIVSKKTKAMTKAHMAGQIMGD